MGCATLKPDKDTSMRLRFLDEYIIPENFMVDSTEVGGLSDLDFDGKYFYSVCDLPSSPRIYKFTMPIKNGKIDTLKFRKTIKIPHKSDDEKNMFWDSEGLVFDKEHNHFILSSEGSIKKNKDPFVVNLDTSGNLLTTYKLPKYFKADRKKGLRNNGVFEGLSQSVTQDGIWVSTELPMKRDGPTVKLFRTKSPVRITYFDKKNKTAKKQFAYRLDRLRKVPLLPFGMNGVSAILEFKPEQFLILERSFSAGHGPHGFRARVYEADARNATNTLKMDKLKGTISSEVEPAEKKLVFDFNTIQKQLTNKQIDNLEGIAFGPKLPNGNQSLVVISDNNFSSWTKQLNQILLFEIIPAE